MEKVKLKKVKIISLVNNAHNYLKTVGEKSDKLSSMCSKVIDYPPNVEFLEKHSKDINKVNKKLERDKRDLHVEYASLYQEGDKKNTFIKDEKGEFVFTTEKQKQLNNKIDILYDEFEERIEGIMNEEAEFYIERVVDLPNRLTSEHRTQLSLLIETPEELLKESATK